MVEIFYVAFFFFCAVGYSKVRLCQYQFSVSPFNFTPAPTAKTISDTCILLLIFSYFFVSIFPTTGLYAYINVYINVYRIVIYLHVYTYMCICACRWGYQYVCDVDKFIT